MTKRDAIDRMAKAIEWETVRRQGEGRIVLTSYDDSLAFAIVAYEAFAEMAKAERKAQSTPATPVPTA